MLLNYINTNPIRHAASIAAVFMLSNPTLAGWASTKGASVGAGAMADLSPAAFLVLAVVGVITFLFASKALRDADFDVPNPTVLALCVALLAVIGLRQSGSGGKDSILHVILLNYTVLGLTLLFLLLFLLLPFLVRRIQNWHLRWLRKRADRELRRRLNSHSNPPRKDRR